MTKGAICQLICIAGLFLTFAVFFCIVVIVCGRPMRTTSDGNVFVYFAHGNFIDTWTFWLVSISRVISIGKQFATKIKGDTFCVIYKQTYLLKRKELITVAFFIGQCSRQEQIDMAAFYYLGTIFSGLMCTTPEPTLIYPSLRKIQTAFLSLAIIASYYAEQCYEFDLCKGM